MALQRAHAASILRWDVIVREGSSKHGASLGLTPLSFVDMLHAIGGGFDTYGFWPLGSRSIFIWGFLKDDILACVETWD
jgi:hypothetical protein